MILAENETFTCFGGRDQEWNRAIVSACPDLRGGYRPPRWARNAHVQNLLTTWRDAAADPAQWDLDERMTAPDGGTISVQWLGLDAPPETPVIVFLHTICGSADDLRRFVVEARRSLGWVVAACNRRGHAELPLTAPQINTMGSTADLRQQLAAIESRRPDAPLYAVGVSAGSGLLVRYLGEEGERSRLRAGVALCPAYDVPGAFRFTHPRYDAYLTRSLVDFFLRRHERVLSQIDGFEECLRATSLLEFHDRLFPLAGFEDRETFFEATDPMKVALRTQVPILVINAADDPVCVERNVHEHLDALRGLSRMTLALTRNGSHCGFHEGRFARRSWAHRLTTDYLLAAHALLSIG